MDNVLSFAIRWTGHWILLNLLVLTPVLSFHSGEDPLKRPAIVMADVIPPGYDTVQTPDNDGHPAEVSIEIVILNIRSVDVSEMRGGTGRISREIHLTRKVSLGSSPDLFEKDTEYSSHSFVADIFFYETWKDERLKYPADKKLEKISLNPEWRNNLWTPDVYFYNAIEAKVIKDVIPYVYLWLKNDSTVIYAARLSIEFSCDMTLTAFPHDKQSCDIIVKSLTHTINEMNLHWDETAAITLGDCIFLPQFELSSTDRSTCNESNEVGKHGHEKFACLRGVIELTRRSGYYIINIYIPSVLIVFMSMLTFWIPVDAVPGRVTLGVTSLLTIITKQYQAFLPSVSYVVALNVWLSMCIGFVFCSLLEYAAVVAVLSHQKRLISQQNIDPSKNESNSRRHCFLINKFYSRLEKIDVHNIDRTCRIAFPAAFCIHSVIYFCVLML